MSQFGFPVKAPDPRDKLVILATFATEQEKREAIRRNAVGWPHIRPNCTMVAPIGNHWAPGAWQCVVDMVQYTNSQGVACWLMEIQDRNFNPFDAMGVMRNEACLVAQSAGFEWPLMVDNDVRPNPDTLLRLLAWDMPIVAPYVEEPCTECPQCKREPFRARENNVDVWRCVCGWNQPVIKLHGPHCDLNTGLRPIRWSVLSMLLFRTVLFNCFPGGTMWADPMGADEGFHFKRLWWYGHRPYLDTNIQLPVWSKPHYPLATNRMSWEDRQAFWKAKIEKLQQPPDRRPINPNVPGVVEGEYMPFLPQVARNGHESLAGVALGPAINAGKLELR